MHRVFSFWWLCAKSAFWGNSAFANDWQWVVGNPAASALGILIAGYFGIKAVTTGSDIQDNFIAALVAFVITWFVAFLVRLFSLPAKYYCDEKERADRNEAQKRKQELLDEISALRVEMTALRVDMDHDPKRVSDAEWRNKFDGLQDKIAAKIEQFSSRAEADAYRHRGNVPRPINTNMGGFLRPLHLDICIHDLDYLKQFIIDYSRNKEK